MKYLLVLFPPWLTQTFIAHGGAASNSQYVKNAGKVSFVVKVNSANAAREGICDAMVVSTKILVKTDKL